jgi:DNA helicase II / ATP-dependent DNA helicase PcrA
VWEAAAAPDRIPGLGTAAVKALRRFMGTMEDLRVLAGMPAPDGREDVAPGADPTDGPVAGGADDLPTDGREGTPGVPVGDLLEAVLSQTGYIEALEAERTIEAQGRIENLEQLVEVGREFDATAEVQQDTLDIFLQQIALVADADTRSEDEGLVTLMTLHNAKGLEYPTVFVVGCEDGVFPHSRALDEGGLEEERRLFYVGVTRAMRQLYLTYARRRAVFGAQTYGLPSRFLAEVPAELTDREEQPVVFASAARGMTGGVVRRASAYVGGGNGWEGAARATAERAPRAAGTNPFRLGEDVEHAAFGEGVVTGVEPGGVIVVRFAGDGSERKLMSEFAPVSRR